MRYYPYNLAVPSDFLINISLHKSKELPTEQTYQVLGFSDSAQQYPYIPPYLMLKLSAFWTQCVFVCSVSSHRNDYNFINGTGDGDQLAINTNRWLAPSNARSVLLDKGVIPRLVSTFLTYLTVRHLSLSSDRQV